MTVQVDNIQTAVWIYDIDNFTIVWANKIGLHLWQCESVLELSQRDLKTEASDAVQQRVLEYREGFKKGQIFHETWQFSPNGIEIDTFCVFSGYELKDGRIAMMVEATPANHFSEITSANSKVVANFNAYGAFISGNPPFNKEFGKQIDCLKSLFCDKNDYQILFQRWQKETQIEIDVLLFSIKESGTKIETWFHLSLNKVINQNNEPSLLIGLYNIDRRKRIEQELTIQASTDELTGLLNRRGFLQQVEEYIQNQESFTLYYIDLDGFKHINDSLGHGYGDIVLNEVAHRLKCLPCVASEIGRFGGDEFLFILPQSDKQNAKQVAASIIHDLSLPYNRNESHPLLLSASVGFANYPHDAIQSEHLIACADAAMYHAKHTGKKRYVTYKAGMEVSLQREGLISRYLRNAIVNEEFCLYYQPIVCINTGSIVSFEALLRWENTVLGQVSPQDTIAVAEKTGLIQQVEEWVLNRAMQDLPLLRVASNKNVNIAVNISGLHMAQKDFLNTLKMLLQKHELNAADLAIELTENVLVEDIERHDSPCKKLVAFGIQLNIDDFGTGFSSLAYLDTIPASIVKVDRSFLQRSKQSTVTLEFMHTMFNKLKMNSLIEGVETEEQSQLMAKIGFVLQQGYFHGRPKPLSYYTD